jgi:hypothetical protein
LSPSGADGREIGRYQGDGCGPQEFWNDQEGKELALGLGRSELVEVEKWRGHQALILARETTVGVELLPGYPRRLPMWSLRLWRNISQNIPRKLRHVWDFHGSDF